MVSVAICDIITVAERRPFTIPVVTRAVAEQQGYNNKTLDRWRTHTKTIAQYIAKDYNNNKCKISRLITLQFKT